MKHFLLSLFFVLFLINTKAQHNLVPNWSFEDSVVCPTIAIGPLPKPWFSPATDYCTNVNSNCFVHRCSTDSFSSVPYNYYGTISYQEPKTGDGYVGLDFVYGTSTRLYVESPLKDSLKKNHYYYCSFWASLINSYQYACNNLAMLLTKNKVYGDTSLGSCNVLVPANPQILNYGNAIITDTMNWVLVSGIYKALGGEQYITLGNFKDDAHTTIIQVYPNAPNPTDGYYIDDISVIPLDSFNLKADAGRDTTITTGDSAFIGSLTNGIDSIKWQILNSNGTIDSIRPGFWVHPLVNTCYVLTQTVNGYTSSDTVCVTVQTVPVVLNSFSAEKSNESAILKWTTSTEINSKNFEVQRSIDGKIFTTIGVVESKGNSTQISNYSFIDFSPYTGTNYYRLKQVDINSKFSLSEMRIVKFSNSNVVDINIYPNPAHSVTTIQIGKLVGVGTIILTDLYGKQLKIQSLNNINNTLDVSDLTKGVYLINVVVDKGKVTKKLIVE